MGPLRSMDIEQPRRLVSDSHLENSKGAGLWQAILPAGQMKERIASIQGKVPELIRARDVSVSPWARGVPQRRDIRGDFSQA